MKEQELKIKNYRRIAGRSSTHRMIVSAEAQEKEGKTTFGLTAPAPIALISLDFGLEGVVEKWQSEKEIYVAEFDYKDVTDPKEWLRMWKDVKSAYQDALHTERVRTVLVDTGTEMWELCRLAGFGKTDHVKPHHYGPVNAEYTDTIREAYRTNKNVILLHKMKEEYVDDKSTGNIIRSGFGNMPYLVQVLVRLWRRTTEEEEKRTQKDKLVAKLYKRKEIGGDYGLTILDCRQNGSLAGTELAEPLNTFSMLGMTVYPDSEEEEWT